MKPPNASFGSADRAGRDTLKAILILCFVSFTMTIWAWDYEGHRMVNQLALAALPTNFPAIDPEKNQDRTKQLVGFLPWTITEYYGKLKSGFSYLKVFEDGGTAEEVANARQNIIYIMGVMGHFVGDASQPLHTTKHY